MSAGPNDAKEQVRQAVDIVDLVGGYIPLRRQGRGYVGICPWHDDSRPSLQVNPDRQSWKCWVCDVGGDAFSFVMQREGIDFREALTMLAERTGVELQLTRSAPVQPGSPDDKQTLYQATAWAEGQFHQCLLKSSEAEMARQYLLDRGISQQSIDKYHLGYAPDGYQWLLDRARTTPFSPQILEAVGLAGQSESGRYYDRFRGRVMFSIRDTQRRPIAFGGRILPQIAEQQTKADRPPAKYINSPETRLFSKSDQLYGLDIVRDAVAKSRQVVVVEGYTDAVMAGQAGLDNVVAVLGTALGERHVRLLRRFADTITLVLDGDEAGQRRTNEILELFVAADVDLRILTLPERLDPCDFLLKQGGEAFREMLTGAVDAIGHKVETETRGINLAGDTHRANQALENILSTLAKAPRLQSSTATSSRLRQQQIISRLAREFRVGEEDLRSRLNELRSKSKGYSTEPQANENLTSGVTLDQLPPQEVELIEVLTQQPELISQAVEGISPERLTSGPTREIYAIYCNLHQAGQTVEFSRVMTELEDPKIKNLYVLLDDRAAAKEEHAQMDASARLQAVFQNFESHREAREHREITAELEERRLDEDEEMQLLLKLHQQQSRKHEETIDEPR